MKWHEDDPSAELFGRAPQGARGLKFSRQKLLFLLSLVAPRKGRVG